MLDPSRWERIQALFHVALDLPPEEQGAFLAAECAGDSALLKEVTALLLADARGASLLDREVAHVADQLLERSPSPAVARQQFGAYRIRKVLGEGGMGVVYLAEREDLGSLAAIKILRDAWLSPVRRERFASEQRTLAQLNHPSIARLYDADTLPEGTPWFVMEYVEGEPLTTYCETHACSLAERLRLFRSVCEAVQHAHLHLVIHRDLKPSNVLVKPDGEIKLLDFGISKHLESLDLPVDQTRTGLRLMTPAYAAPEQIRGAQVGIHTDIYSLGVILYELLAGRLPFDLSDRTPAEVASIIVEREPERPSAAAPKMAYLPGGRARAVSAGKASWADLDVMCLTAMHKDPERRYKSVEALVRDIDHYLAGEPLEARADTVGYRVGKFVRRNWRQVSGAAAILVMVIGLVAFYTIRLTTARNAAVAEAVKTQRIQRFMLNLFQGGDETAGPPDSLRVTSLLDRGVQEARTLSAEPVTQAELYQTLGGIYQKLGDLDRADSLLRAALDQRRSLFGPEHPEVAKSLVALGLLRADQAIYQDAERLVREGLTMSQRARPADPLALARATTALGLVLENRGSYDQAIPVLVEGLRLDSLAGAPPADLSATLTELANVHFYAGHYATSDSLNRRVLALDRALYGERHPHVADDLINLGAIQAESDNYPGAERFYRQALEIVRAWYGDNHPETASDLTMLARVLVPQDRLAEADSILRQALAIQERVYGKVHPRVASALNELGRVAQRQGRLEAAAADFSRMVEIYRAVYADRHYLIGVALSNLAGVQLDQKQYAKAERTFREVIRRYQEVLAPDHQLMGIARVRLGRTLLLRQRYPEAERESLAGYQILTGQTTPPGTWVERARKDLVLVYDSLQQPDKAARFQAELVNPLQR